MIDLNRSSFCEELIPQVVNYIPQIIGIFGTILGTILGWLLKYLQENLGKTELVVNEYVEYIDEAEKYAYSIKLFICNHSLKPKYLKNLRIEYFDKKFPVKSEPKYGDEESPFSNIPNRKKLRTINLKYNIPEQLVLCDLFSIKDFKDRGNYNKVFLVYETEKGKTKKFLIKKNHSVRNINQYPNGKIFPQ